jgi:hypothetical protein
MMGLVLEDPLPTYPEGFPEDVLLRFENETGRGVIGNRPASGTTIIEELGPEQEKTGAWILYTSADSVFQIAAHTGVIPLDELYEASKRAHKMLISEGEIMVERVIARPFHGRAGAYVREIENRHDYGITPSSETYLDRIKDAGHETVAVGKIKDIFDGRGITEHLPAPPDDAAKVDAILDALGHVESGLIFANLVDFDASYGHRRDPEGMAANIQLFDERLPELLDALTAEDFMIITRPWDSRKLLRCRSLRRRLARSRKGRAPGQELRVGSQRFVHPLEWHDSSAADPRQGPYGLRKRDTRCHRGQEVRRGTIRRADPGRGRRLRNGKGARLPNGLTAHGDLHPGNELW